jgi:peptide/nickel transport system substrate-binding protein
MKLSARGKKGLSAELLGPVILALGMLAAACAPAGGSAPSSGSTAAAARATTPPGPGTQAAAPAAAQPTQAAAQSAAGKPVRGGQLTIVMQRDATTFDPTKAQDVYSGEILSLVTDPLFEINDQGQVVGRLVEKTENPEPNVYVFTLKQGIKFQDGTPLDSAAVKFNIERHINDPKATTIQDVKPITSIETPDPQTVKITLSAPFAPFTSRLTAGVGYMLSPTAVQKLADNLQRDLTGAGSGPFKFVSWEPDNQIVLERNPDFWGTDADGTRLPYLDKVVFKPFPDENVRLTNVKTGDADALAGNPPYKDVASLQQSQDVTINQIPGLGFQFVFLNTSKPPFDTPAVRRALSYAIDRNQLNQVVDVGLGTPLASPIPPSLPWAYLHSTPYAARDIDKARQELASAGLSTVSFSLQISNVSPQSQQIGELIKDQVKDAGFDVDLQLLEFATIVQNGNSGDYQALQLAWSGSVDPDGDLYPLFYSRAGFNFARYGNPALDKLLDDGRNNLDQSKRAQAYLDTQNILLQDQPMIVLYGDPQIATARKNVQNYPNNYNNWFGVRDIYKTWLSK